MVVLKHDKAYFMHGFEWVLLAMEILLRSNFFLHFVTQILVTKNEWNVLLFLFVPLVLPIFVYPNVLEKQKENVHEKLHIRN